MERRRLFRREERFNGRLIWKTFLLLRDNLTRDMNGISPNIRKVMFSHCWGIDIHDFCCFKKSTYHLIILGGTSQIVLSNSACFKSPKSLNSPKFHQINNHKNFWNKYHCWHSSRKSMEVFHTISKIFYQRDILTHISSPL